MSVSCVVTNQGNGAAAAVWADGIYFSSSPVFSTINATLLGYVPQSHNVAAGGSYAWTNSVTVPQTPGAYYIFVVADDPYYGSVVYEVTKTNNTSAALPLTSLSQWAAP